MRAAPINLQAARIHLSYPASMVDQWTRTLTVYAEGINLSEIPGAERILVEIDPSPPST